MLRSLTIGVVVTSFSCIGCGSGPTPASKTNAAAKPRQVPGEAPDARPAEPTHQGKTVSEWTAILKQGNPRERKAAVKALGKIGASAEGVLPALIEALKSDKDGEVRNEVVDQLQKMGPAAKDAVPALIGALKDDDEATRWDACEALQAIGSDAKAAVPALIEALKDPVGNVRRHAAEALKAIDPVAAQKAGVK
jgi:HEAT repeat protein